MRIQNAAIRTLASLVLLSSVPASAAVISFDDLSLAPNTWFDPNVTTTFTSGGATFNHDASFGECCWSGFTYSNKSDITTPGYANDTSAITGDGVGAGQDNYGVAYADGARIGFGTAQTLAGAYFTNTTFAYLAMADGNDGNSPPFVKGPFGPGDFFSLTITGLDAANQVTGSVTFLLADGSNVVDDWVFVGLERLGAVNALGFSFASSDTGMFGVNTPTYFAVDNITVVPGPAGIWLMGTAISALLPIVYRSRRGR